eukprot:g63956.t1
MQGELREYDCMILPYERKQKHETQTWDRERKLRGTVVTCHPVPRTGPGPERKNHQTERAAHESLVGQFLTQ